MQVFCHISGNITEITLHFYAAKIILLLYTSKTKEGVYMLTFYSVVVLESIFLMVILGLMANSNDLLPKNKRRLFFILSLIIISATSVEWIGSTAATINGNLRLVHVWTKVVELSLTPLVPFLCAEILYPSDNFNRKFKFFYYVLLIHTILEILSAFGNFIFYVDSNCVFHHGSFYWIYLITYLGGSFYVLYTGYSISRQYQNHNRILLFLMLAYLLFGIAANQIDKSIKVAWLTVSIVVALIYLFYNDMLQRVDEMTMLLNRTSYDNQLGRLRDPVILQYFDVDSFKSVNDEFGHLYGDHCLRTIGEILRNIYEKSGTCYRIGGDEFCVILHSSLERIEELNTQFFAAMQNHRDTDSHFPYISLGYVRYDPSTNNMEESIRIADSMMYRYKERNKIKFSPLSSYPAAADTASDIQTIQQKQKTESEVMLDTSGLTDRTFAAFSSTSDRSYIYLCNMSTMVSRWSPAAVQYFGLPGEYMYNAGDIWETYIHPEDRKMYHDNIEAVFSGRLPVHELEYRARNRFGEYVVCTCRGIVLKGDGTQPSLFAGTLINHGIIDGVDPITGLHNNAEFTKSVHRLLAECSNACIIKLGIEHLRHINAMYGQQGGNRLLKLFGMEVRELIEGRGQLFRLDGAKFALYLYNTDKKTALQFFHQIQEIAETKLKINNIPVPLKVYGGAVLLDDHHFHNDYTVRSSLIYAMEQSLENYHSDLVFSEDMNKVAGIKNIQLHTDIHRSTMNGCQNFFLCYQPIISFSEKRIIGAEVLLRWKKEPYGIVPPDSFIPWLENDPAFLQVGNWILRQAISETRPLRQADPDFILNVNISVTQLEHINFRDDVLNILADSGCAPQNLCLELTERCRHLEPEFLAKELAFFRSHGITTALDDFGTGSSSLSLLLQLPVDELKVDRLFITDIFTNKTTRHLLEHIIECARQAGYRTCIEGIETQEQYDLIASISGDCYQGYYSCRPVPIDEFLKFYQEYRADASD